MPMGTPSVIHVQACWPSLMASMANSSATTGAATQQKDELDVSTAT